MYIEVGRITKDLDLKQTNSGIKYCQFSIAVKRKYKNQEGKYDSDFFNCQAWKNNAEYLVKYAYKGAPVYIIGELQNRTWKDNNNVNHTVTEIIVSSIMVLEYKKTENGNQNQIQNNQVNQNVTPYSINQSMQYQNVNKQQSQFDNVDSQFDISNDVLPF